jgi:hypothetical protein
MKQLFFAFLTFSTFNLVFSQSKSIYLNPDQNQLDFLVDVSTLDHESLSELVLKFRSLDNVKHVLQADSITYRVIYANVDAVMPNEIQNNLQNEINSLGAIINFNLRTIENAFKDGRFASRNVLLANINTVQEANELESLMLTSIDVLVADYDLQTHNLYVLSSINFLEENFMDLLTKSGKPVLNSIEDLKKYE